MDNRIEIEFKTHDIINAIMWDDNFKTTESHQNHIPSGNKIADWLGRGFTLSCVHRYNDKQMYALSKFYQQSMPKVEQELQELQTTYKKIVARERKRLKDDPMLSKLNSSQFLQEQSFKINVSPFPPVIMFIRINTLCDEAHKYLKIRYQFGAMSKSDYFKSRRLMFKPLNRFRAEFSKTVSNAGKLGRLVAEKKPE